ncbi:hypothetical protein TU78_13405 [Pseudomonas taetrolens]|uniref:Uncharacterized protein n=1 Tax=Pseudomonas taetrolens TaxID=47884 RepID=A0A0J6GPE5_PSETA|nr:hypothetical protein TU78_13405 [Pseudomonas taetrolens]
MFSSWEGAYTIGMMATDTAAIVIVDTIGDVITTGTIIIVMTAVSMIAVMTGAVTAIVMMTATTIDALWAPIGAGTPGVTVDSRLAAC